MNPRVRARFERQREMSLRMTREQKAELLRLVQRGEVRFDEPLARHCAMGVGGPAEAFVIVESIEELCGLIRWAMDQTIDLRMWGGGSNTLARNGGVRGLVVKLGEGFSGVELGQDLGNQAVVRAGAATPTAQLTRWCAEHGFSGLECLSGCYGTVGGNLLMNAGMPEGSIGDVVEEVTVIDREGREVSLKRSALRFEYRSLKIPRTMALIRGLFRLRRASPEEVQSAMEKLLVRREETQPTGSRSLGCVFRNLDAAPAGKLIEEAGLKGVRVGGARVSALHANFIINEGRATARDVEILINLIRERVKDQTGISLEPEIVIVGEE